MQYKSCFVTHVLSSTHHTEMKTINPLAILTLLTCSAWAEPASSTAGDTAWKQLLVGNARFVAGKAEHPNQSVKRRTEVAAGQKPFAVIIACADSRTSPELLFDQGLGDLFVVRLAGNIVDDAALGSVEFAVASLGARLIVVLGHEKCGAVKAAVGVAAGDAPPPGHIAGIVESIRPAVAASKGQEGDALENAIHQNVRDVAERVRTGSSVLAPFLKSGELAVFGAYYDLDEGKVGAVK